MARKKTTKMGGGETRNASFASLSPLIDEALRRDFRHQVAALSSAASTTEWVSFGSFPPVPLLSADEATFGSPNTYPRQIFGPSPTRDEPKKASSNLKQVVEKAHYQTNPMPNSREDCQISVSGEIKTAAEQMFSLLHRSSQVQAAVASIASDECVLEAVMKNEAVAEFCRNLPPNVDSAKSVAEREFGKEHPSLESEKPCNKGSMFSNMVNNFKFKVSEKASNISDLLSNSSGNLSSMGANTTVETAEAHHSDRVHYQTNPMPNSREDCQISVSGEIKTAAEQMFSLLHRSSQVQAAVASIASDECVLKAVMKNAAVAEFCRNPPPNADSAKSVAESEFREEHPSLESEKRCNKGSMFSNMVNNLKFKVSEKASNISDLLSNSSGNLSSMGANTTVETAEAHHSDRYAAYALAAAAILVVLFLAL